MFKNYAKFKIESRDGDNSSETSSTSKIITNDERRKNRKPLTPKLKLIFGLLGGIALSGAIAFATRNPLAIAVVNGLLIIAGLWMLISTSKRMVASLASYRWVPVDYTVSDTHFTMVMRSNARMQHNQFTPFFRLNYTYENGDYSVTSEDHLNLHVGEIFATPHRAEQYLSQITEDAKTGKLYVNPDHPEVAFMRRGISRDDVGMLIFSLILIILPILTMMGVIVWRSGTT